MRAGLGLLALLLALLVALLLGLALRRVGRLRRCVRCHFCLPGCCSHWAVCP